MMNKNRTTKTWGCGGAPGRPAEPGCRRRLQRENPYPGNQTGNLSILFGVCNEVYEKRLKQTDD
jgi:hypothetical protein